MVILTVVGDRVMEEVKVSRVSGGLNIARSSRYVDMLWQSSLESKQR